MKFRCPVCGWPELDKPPRSAPGGASYEICPCCGFEFGYDDDAKGLTFEEARKHWIAGGRKWWSASRPAPVGWDATRQLAGDEPGKAE
jgi:hypothetical protein